MSVLAILLEASSLPFVQQPCYLVPVCKCLCTPFGKRACGPLKEGVFGSADQLLQACLETAAGACTLLQALAA